MSARAVHLELVTDLTSDAFIAALKRFIARQERQSEIFSDNGSNFVGTNWKFKEIIQFLNSNSNKISNYLSLEGIKWHFIPANSPNFGGIWEAGIKFTKSYLLRVVGNNANLVFEEFYTILVQIEAILNSRLLIPLSSDPEDLQALTPGHFLVGRQLTAIPEPDLLDVPVNPCSGEFVPQDLV
ncbi:uncharacterized protein [Diabrotica undecimpunctata]|uniref:uncharacterized protein n=1 Tax=Diabrotica undecimpunctata TaxID=50387 RepID=UPI003B636E8B